MNKEQQLRYLDDLYAKIECNEASIISYERSMDHSMSSIHESFTVAVSQSSLVSGAPSGPTFFTVPNTGTSTGIRTGMYKYAGVSI